jgi:hypothetical protein
MDRLKSLMRFVCLACTAGLIVAITAPSAFATPTINISNSSLTIDEDWTLLVPYIVTFANHNALTISASSSNTTLIPISGITFVDNIGTDRFFQITPALNQHGTAVITLTATEDNNSASDTLIITYSSVCDAPTLVAGDDQVVLSSVKLDGSESIIPIPDDVSIATWEWELNHMSNPAFDRTASGKTVELVDIDPGHYHVTLTVSDVCGTQYQDTMRLAALGPWDINGDAATDLAEVIHILQVLSGMGSD